MMTATRRIAVLACLASVLTAGVASAATRIYSYDSASPLTRKMTEGGLTFIIHKTLMSTRVLSLVETHDVGQADLAPADQRELGRGGLEALLGPDANEHDLYELTDAKDGKALGRALCRGSDRVWLVFGPVKVDRGLRVHALGHDPATDKTRLCMTLDYEFHGQWALPPPDLPQPSRVDRFNDAPNNLRY